ncbi:hypothetical protein T10_12191, partial [Trichinella papuae]
MISTTYDIGFNKARAKTMGQQGKEGVIRVIRCDYSSRELSRSDVLEAHILKIFSISNEVVKGKEGLLAMHDKLNGHLLEHDGNCEGNRWHPLHPSYGQMSTSVTCVNIFTEGTNLQQMTVDLIVQPQLNDVYQEEKPMQTTVQLRQTPNRGNKSSPPAQFKRYRRREPRLAPGD